MSIDPGTLVIAALIYFAAKVGEDVSIQISSAIGNAAASPIKMLLGKLNKDPEARQALEAAAADPHDPARARAVKVHVVILEKRDEERADLSRSSETSLSSSGRRVTPATTKSLLAWMR